MAQKCAAITTFKKMSAAAKRTSGATTGQAAKRARSSAMVPAKARGLKGSAKGKYQTVDAGVEMKNFDTAVSFTVDATGEVPATGQWSLIPQGTTGTTRIGRKVVVKSIHFRGILALNPASSATASDTVQLSIVLDTECPGAAASVTDVYTSTNLPIAVRNRFNQTRFQVLKTVIVDMEPAAGATTAYNNSVRHFDAYVKCNIPLEFSGATGAITEIGGNNIFVIAGTSGGTDDLVSCTATARLNFQDL
jgi:hypothetical protein